MIEAHQLTKRYGDKTAVGDLSFTSRSALRSTSAGRRDQEPAANRRRTHARPSGIARPFASCWRSRCQVAMKRRSSGGMASTPP